MKQARCVVGRSSTELPQIYNDSVVLVEVGEQSCHCPTRAGPPRNAGDEGTSAFVGRTSYSMCSGSMVRRRDRGPDSCVEL